MMTGGSAMRSLRTFLRCATALGVVMLLFPGLFFCAEHASGSTDAPGSVLERILEKKEITVITRNNAHCYYFYRDQEMGFEYDLARLFASYLGVDLKVKIAERWEGMIPSLQNGSGDFIAASMTKTPLRLEQVAFSKPYMNTRQHMIVHRGNHAVRRVEDLARQTVHVRKGTSYQERLEELQEAGLDVKIVLHEDTPTEDLIRRVDEKQIPITIADSNIALLNRRYFPRAVIAGTIGEAEEISWAVHPNAALLLEQINQFFELIRKTGKFDDIYNRYYTHVNEFDYVDIRRYHRRLKSRLPRYQSIIRNAAEKNGFDWRLIAAQVYQESHFDPQARSHAGAYGLMQLTKATAESLGVRNIYDPEENIQAGTAHLRRLYDLFDDPLGKDRLFFALAAYNIGQGHVRDAQKLAASFNLNQNDWKNISQTLPLLRFRRYYRNATYGYCRGTEPLEYIKRIMIYYDILKRQGIEYRKNGA